MRRMSRLDTNPLGLSPARLRLALLALAIVAAARGDQEGADDPLPIRRMVLPAAKLPDELIHAPWEARPVDLAAAGVELGGNYPAPIVRHAEARERTLARYAAVKKSA